MRSQGWIGLVVGGAALLTTSGVTSGQMRITEYEYTGLGGSGEFIEFTNVGLTSIDMSGWTFDDSDQLDGPRTSLSAFGTVAPNQSVILSEAPAANFISAWSLSGITVIGSNANNLGRSDEIHLWNASNVQVDFLAYGDQTFTGSIRTNGHSGWPCAQALGNNAIYQWRLSQLGDQQATVLSGESNFGSPGSFTSFTCPPDLTGACCAAGVCTIKTHQECTGVGLYQGDATTCAITCPSPSGADVRITEFMYGGATGEFIEFRNFGGASVNMTGWSFSDESRVPGHVSLSAFTTILAGEIVILTDLDAGDFRADWGLPGSQKVIGGNTVNLGGMDEINLYDNSGDLVDRLTFGNVVCAVDTTGKSAWPCSTAAGTNEILKWRKSAVGDGQGSHATFFGDIGNPGLHSSITCNPGSCCIDNLCSVIDQGDCLSQLGLYLGDGTNCTLNPCPSPDNTQLRITEFMYQGANGEFFEVTNLGGTPVNMNGWSFADRCSPVGAFSLSGLTTLAAGETAVITDKTVAAFKTAWNLGAPQKVLQLPSSELGRNDRIRLHNPSGWIVDQLDYGDEDFTGTPATVNKSAWPLCFGVGTNNIFAWQLSQVGDQQNPYTSTGGDFGSPGTFVQTCVPTVSVWGLLILLLSVLTAGTVVVGRRGAVCATR